MAFSSHFYCRETFNINCTAVSYLILQASCIFQAALNKSQIS